MKRILLALTIILITAAGCNGPLDKKYSKATFEEDYKAIVDSKGVSPAEAMSIGMYIGRAALLGEDIEGMTYKQMLKNIKKLEETNKKKEAEEKVLADKAAAEERKRQEKLSKTITVALYDKGFTKHDYKTYFSYNVAWENKSNKDIRAVKGEMRIYDLFDVEIGGVTLTEDGGIPAGKTIKKVYYTEHNPYIEKDETLRTKAFKDLKVIWKTEKIIFSDGTTLE